MKVGLNSFMKISLNSFYEQLFYKLAQNFSKKLPLIFGKLDLLRKELRSLAVYNFDIVLTSQEKRSEIMSKSILAGGNKELIQNIYSLRRHKRKIS